MAILDFQTYGSGAVTGINDLNLTLNQLQLRTFSTTGAVLSSTLNGNFAFTGTAQIQQLGSGATTTISAAITLGSTATGLAFTGAGLSGTTITGSVASNASTGAPMAIGLSGTAANAGIVTLAGSNTFAGGVVLNSGTLRVTHARGLSVYGSTYGTLTVSGGTFSSNQALVNALVLNSDLVISGTSDQGTYGGIVSGIGGVQVRTEGTAAVQTFTSINTYSGSTVVGHARYAPTVTTEQAGVFRVAGATGSILNSSSISVRDGGTFEIFKGAGDSVNNTRVNPATTLNAASAFVQISGSGGFTAQSLPTVSGQGAVTLAVITQAGVSTATTVPNLLRVNNGTFVFTGTNLGNATAGPGVNVANILLTQIGSSVPSAALVGGGSAGNPDVGIIPYALGDGANASAYFQGGSGFVTYGSDGVRLLNTASEYADVAGSGSLVAGMNNRLTGTPTVQNSGIEINSLFNTGAFNLTGSGTITLTSGALAGTGSFSIGNPLMAGEALLSTIGGLSSPTTITLNGALTANTLTKSSHGTLVLANAGNSLSSNLMTVNAGYLQFDDVAKLGIANLATSTIRLNMHALSNRGGLIYDGGGSQTLNILLNTASGYAAVQTNQSTGILILAGPIAGSGGITYAGVGTISVTGTKTYSGGTRFIGGRLLIDGDLALGDPLGALSVNASAGTLKLAGNWNTARNIGFEGSLGTSGGSDGFDTAGFSSNWSGPIVGSATIIKVDSSLSPGIWTISGADSPYSGVIQLGNNDAVPLPGGTLRLAGNGSLNSASIKFGPDSAGAAGTYLLDISAATAPSGTPWRNFASLATGTGFTQAHVVQLGLTALAPVDVRVGAGAFGGTAGVIQGFGSLVKTGTGTLVLQSANTFVGSVEIWGGTLAVSADVQLGNAGNDIVLKGGALNTTLAFATSRSIFLGPTPIGPTSAFSNAIKADASLTINGNIADSVMGKAGGFELTGSAAVTLNGSNSFTGPIKLSAGTLAISTALNLGAGSQLILNGGTLGNSAAVAIDRQFVVTASSVVTAAASTVFTLNGKLIGSGNLALRGSGTTVLNTDGRYYTGTLTADNVSLAAGTLPRATLNVGSGSATVFDMSNVVREFGTVQIQAAASLQLGNSGRAVAGFNAVDQTWSGSVSGGSSAAVIKVGPGALAIASTGNTFSGGFQGYSGRTTLNAGGTLPAQAFLSIGAWGDISNRGASLRLDNGGTANFARLSDTQVLASNNGELIFQGNGSTIGTETVGTLQGSGYTVVTMQGGSTLDFATGGLVRVNNGTFLFRGASSMGFGAATTSLPNVKFNGLSSELVGLNGGGTQLPVIPYAVASTSATALGTTFATYGSNGVLPLSTGQFSAAISAATGNENVRLIPTSLTTVTLTSSSSVRSLILTGNSDSLNRIVSTTSETLTIDAGLLMTPASQVYAIQNGNTGILLGIQTAELLTGSSNTRALNVFTTNNPGLGNLLIGAKISTTGGLTKSGLSDLFLSNTTNNYVGGTTVNSGNLTIDSLAVANNFSGGLTLAGGYLKYRGADTAIASTITLAGGSVVTQGSTGGIHVVSGVTLSIGPGLLTGFGGLAKEGTGALVLSGTNTFSGAVILQAGTLAIDNSASLGSNGRVIFLDSSLNPTGGGVLRFDAGLTLTQEFITNTATAGVGFKFDTNGNNVTLSGALTSTVSTLGLAKFGTGNLNLTAASAMTGSAQVFGGSLTLAGANGSLLAATGAGGFVPAATFVVNAGAQLVLDNTVVINNNRLPDPFSMPTSGDSLTAGGILIAGGEFVLRGNATTASSEVANTVALMAGTVTLENNGQNVTLTTGRVRSAGIAPVGLIRGMNLGVPVSASSTNWFAIDMGGGSVQLSGAGGASGTPFVSTLPGFMGATTNAGSGSDLITYDAAVGFRPLSAGEYTGTMATLNFDASRAANVRLTGTNTAPSTTSWASALKLEAGAVLNGSASLNLVAGTVLAVGSSSINLPSLGVTAAGNGLTFLTPGINTTLTVASQLTGPMLSKYGEGTLEVSGSVNVVGTVYVGQGTLKLVGSNAALNPLGTSLIVSAGAAFDLGGSNRSIGRLGTTSTVGSFQLNTVQDGTVSLGTRTLTLYDPTSTSFTGRISGSGGLTLAYNNKLGTQTLTQASTYSGATIVRNGTLQLAGSGTLLNTSRVDVIGGTLILNNSDDSGGPGGYIAQRLDGNMPINLAGSLTVTANAQAIQNIEFGSLNLVGGGKLTAAPGAAPTTLNFDNLTRSASKGTFNLGSSGTAFGLTPNPAGNSRVFVTLIEGGTPASSLVGGSGATSTTTISILPWAFASSATSFMTVGANGLRPLNTASGVGAEYLTTLTAGASDNNIRTIAAATLLSGTTEVNSLLHTTGNVTGAASATSTLVLRSGALGLTTTTTTIAPGSSGFLNLNFGTANTREGIVYNSGVLIINAVISTTGGLTKHGAGALTLGVNNTFTGGLSINEGVVSFASDARLGATGGSIRIGGSGTTGLSYTGSSLLAFSRPIAIASIGTLTGMSSNVIWQLNADISGAGAIVYAGASSIFELVGSKSYTGATDWDNGHLSIESDASFGSGGELRIDAATSQALILRGDWTTSRLVQAVTLGSIHTNGFNAIWNGQLAGSSELTKTGTGNLTLTAASSFTGPATVNAGSFILKDAASLPNSGTLTISAGARLVLDDTGVHHSDRLNDTGSSIALASGSLLLKGGSTAMTEEVLGSISLGGYSTITLIADPAQAAILRLTGTLTTAATAVALYRGDNLGANVPGSAGSANLLLFDPLISSTALIGGAGPAGNTAISIIRGGFGDTSPTGLGTQLVTYDADKGVRLLTDFEYADVLVNGTVMSDNVRVTSTSTLTDATTINALWFTGGTVTGSGTLTNSTGNILVTGTGNTISAPVTAGIRAIAIGGPGELTIGTPIPASQTGGLVKSGAGTLTLTTANSYAGGTILAAGTLVIGNAGSLGTSTLTVLGGTLAGNGSPLSITNVISLSGDLTIGGTSDLTLGGIFGINNGTRVVNVGNTGVTTISGLISQSLIPGIGLTKEGAGLLVFTNANIYGAALNGQYYLSTTTVNNGNLRVNNTIGSGTGGSIVVVNSGGTLSGTGTLIPNQSLQSRNTVTVNAGGTIAPGNGTPGMLTIGSATLSTVALQANSRYLFAYTGTPAVAAPDSGGSLNAGVGNPLLQVNGALNIDPNAIIVVVGNASDFLGAGYSFRIASGTTVNSINITDQSKFDTTMFVGYSGVQTFQLHNVGNNVYLNVATPEPAATLLIAGLGAACFFFIRQRRKPGAVATVP